MTIYNGSFLYTQPIADYNASDSPFVNTNGSFTTLGKTTMVNGSYLIVSWAYVFDDSGNSSVDGLYLNGTITTPGNMTIINFDSIPLSRQGRQFKNYIGSFPSSSTNIPTLLANTSCIEMFFGANTFNQDIGSWDTSNVINMNSMFLSSAVFNQDIGSWDTSNVTSMQNMFKNATVFNQDIGNWNTSSVINMTYMFENAEVFNQNIGNWDTSKVTIMYFMFAGATNFNININTKDVGSYIAWNTLNVTNMADMFFEAINFNQDIGDWDTSNVDNMTGLFQRSTSFNGNISNWDTSNVSNMSDMFESTNFNQDISGWDTSNVENMFKMFINATSFNKPLNSWDTSNVNNMNSLFSSATSFNQTLISWDTSNVTDMSYMFYNATSFNQDLTNFTFNSLNEDNSMINMLNSSGIDVSNYDNILNNWSAKSVPINVNFTASGLEYSLLGEEGRTKLINDYNWNITGDTLITFKPDTKQKLQIAVDNWVLPNNDPNKDTYTYNNVPIKYWDTSLITDMIRLFYNKSTFNDDISNWNTSNVTYMNGMFLNATVFNQDISTKIVNAELSNKYTAWDTSNVISILDMFAFTENFNADIGNWNTSKVQNMRYMFRRSIFNKNINTKTVTVGENEYTAWDTSNVINMAYMFHETSFNKPLNSWDTTNVVNMSYMFDTATSFNQDLTNFTFNSLNEDNSMNNMLNRSGIDVSNYDNILNNWSEKSPSVPSNVFFTASGLEYSLLGEAGRTKLINDYNWNITGDTFICFMKNTMILILENDIEVERKVQELKNGDMVKISTGEYKKLVFIGTKTIDITKNIDKIRIMKKGILGDNIPNKDLLVTSGHSVLFKNLENINKYYNENVYDNNVEGYYKMMSQHCKLFDYVKEEELEDISDDNNVSYYHFCLENDDEEGQYGVYSNGVLSETMALSFSKKNFY
jgi:surface protein